MASSYKFHNPNGLYFVTFATVAWVDVFTRKEYAEILLESLRFCQKEKGLCVHSWCIMSNHVHLIISKTDKYELHEIMRDLKKFTSSQIIKAIIGSNESRKNWILWIFQAAGKENPNNKNYQFWQQDNHPLELTSGAFILQKLQYIHRNPVAAGIVTESQYYRYSSAIDYAGGKGLLEVECLM
jgi:putative transposase